ncbi:MAG: hypothetical protein IKK47_04790 [Ruminococcus sp.]|nr:hypothetical protein [Ruminococcus sp.]
MKKKKSAASETAVTKKNKHPMLIIAAVSVLIIALVILAIIYFIGPKKAVKKYVKAGISKNGGKNYFSMILPDYVVDQLKSDEKWNDMIESYNNDLSDVRDDYKFRIKDIEKKDELSATALDGAQLYFEEMAKKYDTKPKELDIQKGFEFEVKLTKKDRNSKKKTSESTVVCAVKIKSEGWKIAEVPASYLKKLSKEQG